jgi:predicted nicotinamide N-methyase
VQHHDIDSTSDAQVASVVSPRIHRFLLKKAVDESSSIGSSCSNFYQQIAKTMANGEGKSNPQRQILENALLQRVLAPPPKKVPWEREAVRGYIHDFGNYTLPITNTSGTEETIAIQEDVKMIATRVWDCATLTSKWIEHVSKNNDQGIPELATALKLKVNPISERPVQVLELGAGTGLLSISLAKMGAAVLSTEYGPVVKYLQDNCERNGVLADTKAAGTTLGQILVSGMVTCRELDWYKTSETLESMFSSSSNEPIFDLVIVTDCSLSEKDTRGVFDMIHKYSSKGHTRVIVGVCNEREGTPLVHEQVKAFQSHSRVETSKLHPNYTSSRHTVLIFDT